MALNRKACVATLAVSALSLAACGGGDSASTSEDAGAGLASRGPITYVQGKDNSDVVRPLIALWNKDHPDEEVTFEEQSDEADEQHADLVQHFQTKDPGYDVVSVDVVWTAEFAAKGWLQPLEGDFALDTSALLPATVSSATYNDKLYAAPQASDGGMLYYRKDLVDTPPATWDEMMGMCSIAEENDMDCYAGQFDKYEGLTVNAAEAINTAGGVIVGDDGVTPEVTSDEATAGLTMLADAYANGNIPKGAITYTEEEGRISFEKGDLLFLRNWPYVYTLAATEASSKVKDTFGVAPLPGLDGPGASSLGGHNAAISVYSDHKATAIDFLKFIEGKEAQDIFTKGSLAPVVAASYDDPALIEKFPFLPVLKTSIENAVPRPVTPFYPAVTLAIQENAYAAITGEKSVDDALADMEAAIKTAAAGG